MVRKAALIALALAAPPASAQTSNTQCRWIGNIWSCNSQGQPAPNPAPVDQGAILRSGASVVPPYQPTPPQPLPQLSTKTIIDIGDRAYDGEYGPDPAGVADVNVVVDQCRRDILAMLARDKERIASPLFDGNGLNDTAKRTHRMICAAYQRGMVDGAKAASAL